MKNCSGALQCIAAVAGALLAATVFAAQRTPEHAFFADGKKGVQVLAHRGGAGLRPENTLAAFTNAATLGADILEMDVQLTADGAIVVMHDVTVDRTTNGTGRVDSMTLAALRELDAAYRWSRDGGKTFPYRASRVRIPALDEIFARFPLMRMNIEMKNASPALAQALCALTRQRGMSKKILAASMNSEAIATFRRECPEAATSMTASEAKWFYALHFVGLTKTYKPNGLALQMPYRLGERVVATADLIQAARGRGLKTHVWTINDEACMRELIAAGIDGIITDRPDVLLKVLGRGKID